MEKLADGIWAAEKDFRMPGGLIFRSRMTAVDLGDGELLLHSPVELGEDDRKELNDLGEVRWIVAPSDLHDSDFASTAEQFPDAKLVAPEKVRAKNPDLEFARSLEDASWRGLESVTLGGAPRWNETVFVHQPTGSLICSDFVFNITEPPNFITSLVLRMVGCHRCFAQSRSVRYLFVRNREAFAASVGELMQRDFDRVIMCHGDVIDSGGRALIEREVSWAWQGQLALLEA